MCTQLLRICVVLVVRTCLAACCGRPRARSHARVNTFDLICSYYSDPERWSAAQTLHVALAAELAAAAAGTLPAAVRGAAADKSIFETQTAPTQAFALCCPYVVPGRPTTRLCPGDNRLQPTPQRSGGLIPYAIWSPLPQLLHKCKSNQNQIKCITSRMGPCPEPPTTSAELVRTSSNTQLCGDRVLAVNSGVRSPPQSPADQSRAHARACAEHNVKGTFAKTKFITVAPHRFVGTVRWAGGVVGTPS